MAQVRLRIIGECVIEVGERQIGPEAPYLFALLLVLGCEAGRFIPRMELNELLFSSDETQASASHNLRQLLYRLRAMGAPIMPRGNKLTLSTESVIDALSAIEHSPSSERQWRSSREFEVLPSYTPNITAPLADWLNSFRDIANSRLRAVLLSDFCYWQTASAWQSVLRAGRSLLTLDPSNEEVITGLAEASYMLGRKSEALEELDAHISASDMRDGPSPLVQLRSRIAKAQSRHAPTLGTFAGRDAIISALSQSWSKVSAGTSQFTLLVGAAGIGKTRIADALASYVALAGGAVLSHRCDTADYQRPYSLFTQLVPHLRRMRGSLGAAPEGRPYLNLLTSESVPETSLEPASVESLRREIQLALLDLLDSVSSEKALLLSIDDAHSLDYASWEVVRSLSDTRKDIAVMILCCSRRIDRDEFATLPTRCEVHHVGPLADTDSLALLKELLPQRDSDEAFLSTALLQAAGNPYYIHALARQGLDRIASNLPSDIRTLASSSYYSLDTDARALLEACLSLGRLSTLPRVDEVTSLSGHALIRALRRLEGDGLLHFVEGRLRCPHALLEDALKELIPSSVAALLHARIAAVLEHECKACNYPTALAWAAAEHFIAATNYGSATELMMLCAAQAAGVGEPRAAAQMLLQVGQARLPLPDRISIYDSVVDYAEAAGDRELAWSALRERHTLGEQMGESQERLQELAFRELEASLQQGADPAAAVPLLSRFLSDEQANPTIRVRAGIRLLVAADLFLDCALAESTFEMLQPVLARMPTKESLRRRAELVYQTVFGDPQATLCLVQEVLRDNPLPSLAQSVIAARHYAAFSLSRMGLRDLAKPVLLADYSFMSEHHVVSESLYSLTLLLEIAIADGDMTEAASLLAIATAAISKGEPYTRYTAVGFYSACAQIALAKGRPNDAEKALEDVRAGYPAIVTPRMLAMESALLIRAKLGRSTPVLDEDRVSILRSLFQKGAALGGQDEVVAALCAAAQARGRPEEVHELLATYLSVRRETSPLEWCLRPAASICGILAELA
jgi:DNA-binding SARP family transcriptional activator